MSGNTDYPCSQRPSLERWVFQDLLTFILRASEVLPLSLTRLSTPWIDRTPLMIAGDVLISDAVQRMHRSGKSYAVVVQTVAPVHCLGIFSTSEVMGAIATGVNLATTSLQDIVTPPIHTLIEAEVQNLYPILSYFEQYALNHAPVLDDQGNWVAIIAYESCLKAYHAEQKAQQRQPLLLHPRGEIALKSSVALASEEIIPPPAPTSPDLNPRVRQLLQHFCQGDYLSQYTDGKTLIESALHHLMRAEINERLTQQIQVCKSQLATGEDHFRQLVEHIDSIFWITNPERTEILYQSPAYQKFFGEGQDSEMVFPAAWYPLIHPADQEKVINFYNRDLVEKDSQEFRIIQQDGTVCWLRNRAFPIHNSSGGIDCLVGIADDITLYKQTEEALQKSLQTLSDFKYGLDQIALVASVDSQGHILEVNEKFSELAQASPEQLLGRFYGDLCVPPESETFWQEVWTTLAHNFIWQGEIQHQTPRQRTYWVNVTFIPFFNEAGKPQHYLMIGFEIQERKRAEAEMLKTLIREKELGELKSNFITITSHEFRTPLTIIQCSVELLTSYPLSPEDQQEELQAIQDAVAHLTHLLDDLLILSRGESEQLQCKWNLINVSQFCQRLLKQLKAQYPDHRLKFEDKTEEKQTVAFITDSTLLQQILINLLSNALKYSSPDDPVELKMTQTKNHLILEVCDRGIGIPPEAQEHLGTAFYRASNVGSTPGTGLGLAIVKTYVDLLQGTLQIQSQLGEGTTVKITLPHTPS
ncbi:PAS domain S-box protein [Spirulina subsalsa FACHB-351]|uniref:histidine kinase n=1 Tax=Spirulina subsalsa FACHB-351 TaxID=234711 RepID=A0ABT3L2G3_9CYAN|nr:ATP-binding protein [Spirulina subsalsa]MCW6035274.1 PAS domain S-box protein [Spirulina subsalsa FACHB-351]